MVMPSYWMGRVCGHASHWVGILMISRAWKIFWPEILSLTWTQVTTGEEYLLLEQLEVWEHFVWCSFYVFPKDPSTSAPKMYLQNSGLLILNGLYIYCTFTVLTVQSVTDVIGGVAVRSCWFTWFLCLPYCALPCFAMPSPPPTCPALSCPEEGEDRVSESEEDRRAAEARAHKIQRLQGERESILVTI